MKSLEAILEKHIIGHRDRLLDSFFMIEPETPSMNPLEKLLFKHFVQPELEEPKAPEPIKNPTHETFLGSAFKKLFSLFRIFICF